MLVSEFLETVLDDYENDRPSTHSGFCWYAATYHANRNLLILLDQWAPVNDGSGRRDFWFPLDHHGHQQRIELLKKAIEHYKKKRA